MGDIGFLPMLAVLIGLFFGSRIVSTLTGWKSYRIVLRGHAIGFDAVSDDTPVGSDYLSEPVRTVLGDDPRFAVLIGRPAGFINFVREMIGIPRRFEFVLASRQAVIRHGSVTHQSIKLAKLSSLGSVDVQRDKRNPLFLLLVWMVLTAFFSTPSPMNGYNPGGAAMFFSLLLAVFLIGYYVLTTVTEISLTGEDKIRFSIYPPLLERLSGRNLPDVTLADTVQIVQIFRILKDQ